MKSSIDDVIADVWDSQKSSYTSYKWEVEIRLIIYTLELQATHIGSLRNIAIKILNWLTAETRK